MPIYSLTDNVIIGGETLKPTDSSGNNRYYASVPIPDDAGLPSGGAIFRVKQNDVTGKWDADKFIAADFTTVDPLVGNTSAIPVTGIRLFTVY